MKVAVFGAAGWLGRAVLENFAGKHEVRAVEINPEAWDVYRDLDGEWEGEKVYGDIADFHSVDKALKGMDSVVHLTAYFGSDTPLEEDEKPFLVNIKGLWNVLESARRRELVRVVHMGSCQVQHPKGIFFTSDVRRPDAGLYSVAKRLQEEMCRQHHDAYGQRIIVFRPASISDSRLGINRDRTPAGGGVGWVCRHDLAQACHLALENDSIDFDIMHTASHPDADQYCNVARSREILGLEYKGPPPPEA
jgi:nucleoside-diphosphate-sugar epimerase